MVDLTSKDGRERLGRLYRYAQVGRCVNSVTHDLNNYLGAIMAYAELIAMDAPLSDETNRMLEEIVTGVKRCSNLVNDLTGIARRERADASLVNMAGLVERVVNLRRYDFQVAHVELTTDLASDAGDIILDRPKVEQSLIYLLTNALEAALESDDKRAKVTLSVSDNDELEVAISNGGEAIPEGIRDIMFEPYFSTKGDEHIGLGLTVAREIAQMHEGSLTYSPDRGIVLSLPRENPMTRKAD